MQSVFTQSQRRAPGMYARASVCAALGYARVRWCGVAACSVAARSLAVSVIDSIVMGSRHGKPGAALITKLGLPAT